MNLRINRSIAEQTKVSYAIESAGPLPYDIDCGEGINTVMVPLLQNRHSKNWISK